ncbi:MAG: arginine deiminase [Lachnospiraceae bacterium]|nr:arginine deiminase [Lachnospiraceae bacterium]
MIQGVHNYSEIGKLNKVMLHRIGSEVDGLVPDNFARLLFDDIPYLKVAMQEHDTFAKTLRDNGVEVVYYVDEFAKAIADPKIRLQFIREMLDEVQFSSPSVKEAVCAFLSEMEPLALGEKVIAGIRKDDLPDYKPRTLAERIDASYPFYMDPLPNMYFTRDQGACVGNGLTIHHMSTATRRRESLLLKYIYEYNKEFAPEGTKRWFDYNDPYSLEGGDILVLNHEVVGVGLSERTSAAGIERFAENLLHGSDFKEILVFQIPKKRAFMHLDTVFTMVDYDKFTIHPEIEGPLQLFQLTLGRGGEIKMRSMTERLQKALAKELKLPAVELIRCGGDDVMAAQREQWNDGSNTLCIAPGRVITYERNNVTNDLLTKRGIEVLTIPSSELSRGRGGPRCMSCPVNRDDL